ncbi:MAG: stage II sporulation protein M [Candidatus Aenigmarchaeota archaeon]|nr:stage II sporulation protein M [Candidatus Aenigmarchaeota archaeon]
MLESLFNFREINSRPYLAFLWAFAIISISVIIAMQIGFKIAVGTASVNLTGIFTLAFALISSSYIMTAIIRREELMEEKAIRAHYSKGFWERHRKDLLIFLYFFGGATLAFAVWTMLLPADTFQVQIPSICAMRPYLSVCDSPMITGSVTSPSVSFMNILTNNLRVTAFSFVFAFIFGAGAVFILLWNAGILGICIGLMSRSLAEIPVNSIRFLPHGIPEIAGYILAGLAGSLISIAIIRKADRNILKSVAWDSAVVLIIGVVLVVLGAFIEAYL